MRLLVIALLFSAASGGALAGPAEDVKEDAAHHACIAAAVAFSAVAPNSHGSLAAVESANYRAAFLKKFGDEWHAAPTGSLKSLLLESYSVATQRMRLYAGLAQGVGKVGYEPDFDDAERELGIHCMYALGKLDGEGRLLNVLGVTTASH